MNKNILNDSQMKKINGAGVYSYIKGGLKIAFGAAMAVGTIHTLDKTTIIINGKERSNIVTGIALTTSLASIASGINDILFISILIK